MHLGVLQRLYRAQAGSRRAWGARRVLDAARYACFVGLLHDLLPDSLASQGGVPHRLHITGYNNAIEEMHP